MVVVHRPSPDATEYERVFVETARAAGFGETHRLPPLKAEHLHRIVLDVFARRGREISAVAAEDLVRRSAGLPLRAVDAALSAATESNDGANPSAEPMDDAPALSTAPRFISWPTHPNADRLLALLAAAGRPVHDYEIASILGMEPGDLSKAAAAAAHAGLTTRTGSVLGLSHESYREVIEGIVPNQLGNMVRAALAEHLARDINANPAVFYEAAAHFFRAGAIRRAEACATKALTFAESLGSIRGKVEALELLRAIRGGLKTEQAVDLASCLLVLKDLQRLGSVCDELEVLSQEGTATRNDADYLRIAASQDAGTVRFEDARDKLLRLADSPNEFRHLPDALVLLLRTADKTGDLPVMKAAVKRLRKLGASGTKSLAAHAEFGTGYLFARYYFVDRAIPHLRNAVELAEAARNWTLHQQARDGLGITLKQAGRIPESIEQFEISLDLARKMLAPHAEASALQNRGLSEMLMGELDAAEETLSHANALGEAGWGYRLFNRYNLALLALYRNELERAVAGFAEVHQLSISAGVITLAADAAAMSALVWQRMLDKPGFLRAMDRLAATTSRLTHRRLSWVDLAAEAWQTAWLGGDPLTAVAVADRRCNELRRRDVAHWLSLEAEIVRIEEAAWGDSRRRPWLTRTARELNCQFVERCIN
jgi:tetratricopeptide (TPR) repeat protein